ncbi:hypothetical protein TNCV_4482441 [Trichonephila clavipes]|nr:hypothetical protein TNCV_4482441 [Trichonephila clavipes]
MLQDYDTSFSRVYFSRPRLFSSPSLFVPTFFLSVVARSFSFIVSRSTCCQVQAAVPYNYFLWGYVKSLVYADKPQPLDPLEDNIRRVIADIRTQMLEKVIENRTSRLDYIRASRGSPMPEVIFKM